LARFRHANRATLLLENAIGQPAISGGMPEIQPHQHLIGPFGGRSAASKKVASR
jgi:hypothetical protein